MESAKEPPGNRQGKKKNPQKGGQLITRIHVLHNSLMQHQPIKHTVLDINEKEIRLRNR